MLRQKTFVFLETYLLSWW